MDPNVELNSVNKPVESTPEPVQQTIETKSFPNRKIFFVLFPVLLLIGAVLGFVWSRSNVRKDKVVPVPAIVSPTVPDVSITPSITSDTGSVSGELSTPAEESVSEESVEELGALVQSQNVFGISLFKNIFANQKTDSDGNVFISPTSVSLALSMAYHGAKENTQAEMAKVLNFTGIPTTKINQQSLELIKSLNTRKDATVKVANSMWLNSNANLPRTSLKPEYVSDNEKYYQAVTKRLDFQLPTAAQSINSWVNETTKGRITEIVPSPINKDVVMYLINAVYFKGLWNSGFKFDKALTKSAPFYSSKGTVNVQMMKQTSEFVYSETPDFQAVQIPYGEEYGELQMTVYLPKSKSIKSFVDGLSSKKITEWDSAFGSREGTLLLPKFKVESDYSLKSNLEALGMKDAFSDTKANFVDGIVTKDSAPIYIGNVIHKTFVEVNEEGTEAAASTALDFVTMGVGPWEKPFLMEVNKPFVVTIGTRIDKEILFIGVISNPSI